MSSVFTSSINLTESFSAPELPDASSGWSYYDGDGVGRILVTDRGMQMDTGTYGQYALNEAILTQDLSGAEGVTLSFDHSDVFNGYSRDEQEALADVFTGHYNGDGVAISMDGETWYTIVNADELVGAQSIEIDLDAAVAGIQSSYDSSFGYSDSFQIKFQQYDNTFAGNDGRIWDNIALTGTRVITDDLAVSVDENISTSDVIHTAYWEDAVQYSLSGTDAAAFNIDAVSGEITFVASPDYETQTEYVLTVVATNAQSESISHTLTIQINDVQESSLAFTGITALKSEGFDGSELPTDGWSYYDGDGAGRILVTERGMQMDTGTYGVYALNEAILTQDLSGAAGITLSFDHSDVFNGYSRDEQEALADVFTGHYNGDGVAISMDGETWYTIVNADELVGTQSIEIDLDAAVASIQSSYDPSFGYSDSFQIKFQQYDNGSAGSDGRIWDNIELIQSTVLSGAQTIQVDEAIDTEQVVYTLTAKDFGGLLGSSGFEYSLTGTDAAAFNIDAVSGEITFVASPDYETQTEYVLTVVATHSSGSITTQSLTIQINDLVEPSLIFQESAGLISEGFDSELPTEGWSYYNSDGVGRILATDRGMQMDSRIYTEYALNEAILTQDLSGLSDVFLSFDHSDVFNGYSRDEQHVLADVFTGHYNGDGVAISMDGETWYTIVNADELVGTQSIEIDLDAAVARIQSDYDASFGYSDSFQIKFQQYDNTTAGSDGRIWDNIELVSKQPIGSELTLSVDENINTSQVIYTPDVGDSNRVADTDNLEYSLSGTDAAAFSIDTSTGEVRFTSSPDYETKTSYSFTVVATFDGETVDQSVSLTILDQDDSAPVFTNIADLGLVVAWASYGQDGSLYGIYAQRYAADGSVLGDEFRVNTTTANNQYNPAVTMLANGGFVISWQSDEQDGSDYGIYAQVYNADGTASGDEFQVNQDGAFNQQLPEITALAGGGFVVVWQTTSAGEGDNVEGQIYDAAGRPVGENFALDDGVNLASYQSYPLVSATSDGGFWLVWNDSPTSLQRYDANGELVSLSDTARLPYSDPDAITTLADDSLVLIYSGHYNSSYGTYSQRIDSTGELIGNVTTISTTSQYNYTDDSWDISVTALDNGGYAVAWAERISAVTQVFAQAFDADGTAISSRTTLDSGSSYYAYPAITSTSDGGYLVTWTTSDQASSDTSGAAVEGQRFDADGNAVGEQFLVNTYTSSDQVGPDMDSWQFDALVVDLDEHSGTGQVVYTATVTDTADEDNSTDTSASVTLQLLGTDAALFTLDTATGQVTLTADPNHETQASYDIVIRATDAAGNQTDQAIQVVVNDLDEQAPAFTSANSVSIDENIGAGQLVHTAVADDTADYSQGVTYSLQAIPGSESDLFAFEIDADTGELRLIANPDYETQSSYAVTLVATDAAGFVTTQDFTLTVNDLPEVSPVSFSLDENSGPNQLLHTASGGVSYALIGNDAEAFTLDTSTGEIRFTDDPNHEYQASYSATVLITDAQGTVTQQQLTLTIQDLDETAPEFNGLDIIRNGNMMVPGGYATESIYLFGGTTYQIDIEGSATGAGTLSDPYIEGIVDPNGVLLDGTTNDDSGDGYNSRLTFTPLENGQYEIRSGGFGSSTGTYTLTASITNGSLGTQTSVDENVDTGALIYPSAATDTADIDDATDTSAGITYALSGTDASSFSVDAAGNVTLDSSPDYETQSSYEVELTATDAAGNASTLIIVLNINDLADTAPVFTSSANPEVNENLSNDDVVYTPTLDTVADSWALSGVDSGKFSIDASTGVVTLNLADGETLDHETLTSYEFVVTATNVVASTSQAVTLSITDLDESAPIITSSPNASIDEGSAVDSAVFTAIASDQADIDDCTDSSADVVFSLSGADVDAFNVDASTGAITLAEVPDYEVQTSYSFNLVATDAAGNATSQAVTVSINNLDDTAPSINSSNSFSVDENAGENKVVGTVTATDVDSDNGTITYGIQQGTGDAALFNINSNSGALTLISNADYETESSYSLLVTATDESGNSSSKAVQIQINDVDENPPNVTSGASANSIEENTGIGAIVYEATAANQVTQFALSGADAGLFTIDNYGYVRTVAVLNHEAQSQYSFTVTLTNQYGSTDQIVTLDLTDVDEKAPTITSGAFATDTPETAALGTTVYTATAVDEADIDDSTQSTVGISYSLGGNDAGYFNINGNTGKVSLASGLDYESRQSYSFEVTATDAVGNSSTQQVSLTVLDVNEGPVFGSSSSAYIAENVGSNQLVYTALATDVDGSGSITYRMGTGGDSALFSIDASTGAVSLSENPDYETQSSYSFTVIAEDASGRTTEKTVILAINDVAEFTPAFTSGNSVIVNENIADGSRVYTSLTDTVADSFSLSGADAGLFSIDALTGAVSLISSPDHEIKSVYQFSVVASNQFGSNQQDVTLTVSDLDESLPVFTSGDTASTLTENSGAGQTVYTAAASDTADLDDGTDTSGDLHYYLASVGDYSYFSINSYTGVVTLNGNPNYETKPNYSFTVVARDDDGNTASQQVSLAITDLDDAAPVFTSSYYGSVVDGFGASEVVYTAAAFDSDSAAAPIFSIKAGGDANLFSINADTGELTLLENADLDTRSQYSLTLIATDESGHASERDIVIRIADPSEPPAVFTSASSVIQDENTATGITVYTANTNVAVDTFSLAGIDASYFSIDSSTGVVTLTQVLDHESQSTYSFTLVASNAGGVTEHDVTLTLNDVDESTPVYAETDVSISIDENEAAYQTVYTTQATDTADIDDNTDASASLIYSLAGADSAYFSIDGDSGDVTFNSSADHETQASYSLTLITTDTGGNTTEQNLTININDLDESAPVFTSANTLGSISDQAPAGTLVYSATSTDTADIDNSANTSSGISYSLIGTDASAFSIHPTTGEVTIDSSLDYATKSSYRFTVVAQDAAGNRTEQALVLNVAEIDTIAPTFTSGSTATSVDENSAAIVVYTATSDDADATYTLGGTDAAAFSIANGVVTFNGGADYETQSSYSFTVTAEDAAGNSSTQTVTMAVNDLDEVPPVFTSGTTATAVDENGIATEVYAATSDDTDATYTLGGADAASFRIANGVVTFSGSADYETQPSYSFTVIAEDAAGNTSTQTVSMAVNDLDDTAPVFSSGTAATAADENGAAIVVYTVSSDDPGATYTLSGTDAASFSIANGVVTFNGSADYETQSSYSFTVIAEDGAGNTSTQTVTMMVNDLDEVAPVFTSGTTASAVEENGSATVVYTATSDDANATYTLGGTDADSFTIANGIVTFNGGADYETQSSYSFTVTAEDAAGNTSTQTVTMAVTDIADEVAPVFSSATIASAIDENSGANQIVYTAQATDSVSAVTYSLGGADVAVFSINENTGEVTLTENPDYETKNSYSFIVYAEDAAGNSSSQTVSLSVNDVDDTGPVFTSGTQATSVDENGTATVVYTATSDDPGATYTLGGTDAASFSISSGVVTFNGGADYETKSSYSITVTATDAAGNSSDQTVTMAVNDRLEQSMSDGSTWSLETIDGGDGTAQLLVTRTDVSGNQTSYTTSAFDWSAGYGITSYLTELDGGNVAVTFQNGSSYLYTLQVTSSLDQIGDLHTTTTSIKSPQDLVVEALIGGGYAIGYAVMDAGEEDLYLSVYDENGIELRGFDPLLSQSSSYVQSIQSSDDGGFTLVWGADYETNQEVVFDSDLNQIQPRYYSSYTTSDGSDWIVGYEYQDAWVSSLIITKWQGEVGSESYEVFTSPEFSGRSSWYRSELTEMTNGNVLITFTNDGRSLYAYLFNSSFEQQGDLITISNDIDSIPAMEGVELSDGSFVVVWEDYYNLYARTYDASGSPISDQFDVSSVSGYVSSLSAVAENDGGFTISWTDYGGNGSRTFGSPDNIAPVFSSGDLATSVDENGDAIAVYSIVTDDPDALYSLEGADSGSFILDNGSVIFNGSADYEIKSSYSFTVVASDPWGNSSSQIVTMAVNDLDDTPPVFTSGAVANSADENGDAVTVYTITTDEAATYSLSGTDEASFTLNGNTVTFNGNADFETQASYQFTITATDAAGNSSAQSVTMAVNDVDEVLEQTLSDGSTWRVEYLDGEDGTAQLLVTKTDVGGIQTSYISAAFGWSSGTGGSSYLTELENGNVAVTVQNGSSYLYTLQLTNVLDQVGDLYTTSTSVTFPQSLVVEALVGGGYAIGYSSSSVLYLSVYDENGLELRGFDPLLSRTGSYTQSIQPSDDGGFILVWGSDYETNEELVFDSDLNQIQPRYYSSYTTSDGSDWIVGYEYQDSWATSLIISKRQDEVGSESYGVFNSPEFYGRSSWYRSDLTEMTNGNVLITFSNDGNSLYAYLFNSSFEQQGDLITISNDIYHNPDMEVVELTDGNFVVVWEDYNDIYAKAYDANGNPLTDQLDVATTSNGYFYSLNAIAENDGGFTVTWFGYSSGYFNGSQTFGQPDNSAPIFSSGDLATAVDENSAAVAVYTIVTDDADATYSLEGTDSGYFTLSNETVIFNGGADYESKNSYSFTVTATDAWGNSSSQPVTMAVNDLDDTAPTFTSGTVASSVDENGDAEPVYTISTDEAATYSLSGVDAASFTLNGNTVIFNGSADFEAQSLYQLTITATDAAGNQSFKDLEVYVNDLYDGPAITSPGTATAIDENSGSGQVVYTITSVDPNAVYSLSGTDAAAFSVDSNTGEVSLIADPDAETKSTYSFEVLATNNHGESGIQAVTLEINDLDDSAPVFISGGLGGAVSETEDFTGALPDASTGWSYYSSNNGRIYLFNDSMMMDTSANDALNEAIWTHDLSGAEGVTLSFDQVDTSDEQTITPDQFSGHYNGDGVAISNDGYTWYTVIDATALNVSGSFTLDLDAEVSRIQSQYDSTFGYTSSFSIKFQQFDNFAYSTDGREWDNIVLTSDVPPVTVDENSGSNQVVYIASATDTADVDDNTDTSAGITYSLSGADVAYFSIDRISGEVTLLDDPDYETRSSYDIELIASDAAGNQTIRSLTIDVNNLNDGPAITSPGTATAIDENSGAGQLVYTVTSMDPNAVYSLSGTDATAFNINSSTGEVTLIGDPDAETQSSYSFDVIATNSQGESGDAQTVTLAINDLDESAPVLTLASGYDYQEDFSGALPDSSAGWSYYSSNGYGRIRLYNINSSESLLMDSTSNGNYVLNEAIWEMNLSGAQSVELSYDQIDSYDEETSLPSRFTGHYNGDGVAISNDGVTWYTVVNASTLATSGSYVLDLDTEISRIQSQYDASFDYSSDFQIKFQQYDNYAYTTDGRAWDNIQVTSANGNSPLEIDENSGANQLLFTVDATDTLDIDDGSDNSSNVTYSVSGTDAALFNLDSNTGELVLLGDPDYETQSSYEVVITATDDSSNATSQTVVITVNDLEEPAEVFG